jgi:2-polyprenyl-3-methyl-5-hydroxy-6-metoxy-1,4-benzoquinol methylase
MPELDFITSIHRSAKRNYLDRVIGVDKAECAVIAKKFGRDYWDGDRKHGYGGYHYDGRWRPVAEAMAAHYGLKAEHEVLDLGCGKGFLLHELAQVVPGLGYFHLRDRKRQTRG